MFQQFDQFFIEPLPDDFRGIPHRDAIGRDVAPHHRAFADDGPVPDVDAREDNRPFANPDVIADDRIAFRGKFSLDGLSISQPRKM